MDLKHNMNAFMRAKGWSTKDLSDASGVPVRTIEDIRQRNDCRLSTIKRLAEALETSIDILAGKKVKLTFSILIDESDKGDD